MTDIIRVKPEGDTMTDDIRSDHVSAEGGKTETVRGKGRRRQTCMSG